MPGRLWSIIVPEPSLGDITNLVTNPSLERDSNGWTAEGTGSLSRVYTMQVFGTYAVQVDCSASGDGAKFDTVPLVSGVTYTAGVWVLLGNLTPGRLEFKTTGGVSKGTPNNFLGTSSWQRVYVTWTADATASFRISITRQSSGSAAIWIDGLQVVALDHDVTHIDGDQDGCAWVAVPHASTSYRSEQSRAGGKEVFFDDMGVYVTSFHGIGVVPSRHHTLNQALIPGAHFQGRKVLPRTITLNVESPGATHEGMHLLRDEFIRAVMPDVVKGDQPFILRYYGANVKAPLEIDCTYDSGLEFLKLDGFTDQSPVRFISYDNPFWRKIGNDAAAPLNLNDSHTLTGNIMRRQRGGPQTHEWQKFGTGMNGLVHTIRQDRTRGRVYVGGAFTTGNAVTLNRIGYWDGTTFVAMDAGVNGDVYDILIEPDGDVWVAGAFTTVGSAAAACKGLARWNYSSGTWTAFNPSTATFTRVETLAMDTSENLYIGGTFTDWNGLANGDYIAKYDGTAWSALGTGMNSFVYALAVDGKGNVWAGGNFTTGNGVTLNYVGYWNGTTFVSIGGASGSLLYVNSLVTGIDGSIFIGGGFTTIGGVPANRIARWNGSSIEALSTGFDAAVVGGGLDVDDKGVLYAVGSFTTAGGLTLLRGFALWNGYTWLPPDLLLPSAANPEAVVAWKGDVFIGYNSNGTATSSGQQNCITNGTAITYPVLKISGVGFTSTIGGEIRFLRNETLGVTLWFNYKLARGEELTVDFRPTKRSIVSSYYGNVWRALLRGSEFASFHLLPGLNWVSLYVESPGSGTITALLEWRTEYLSADGA